MPFLHQEEPFQASRRACSRMLKGLSLNVEGRGQDWRGMKKVYKFRACEKRGQCDACGRKERISWQDSVAKKARQRGKDGWTGRSR